MHFQFEVSSQAPVEAAGGQTGANDSAEILRQMLEVQREQLQMLRHNASAHDAGGRWRAVLLRWQDDFSTLPAACKRVLPQLERAYIALIADLTEYLRQEGDEAIGNEFSLGEFLDRFGIRLNQLGAILSLVGPLADIAEHGEETKQEKRQTG
jgi:hypothetical protein